MMRLINQSLVTACAMAATGGIVGCSPPPEAASTPLLPGPWGGGCDFPTPTGVIGLTADLEAAGWRMPDSSDRWEVARGPGQVHAEPVLSADVLAYRCDEAAGCILGGERVERDHTVFRVELGEAANEALQLAGPLVDGQVDGLCGWWRGGPPTVGLGEMGARASAWERPAPVCAPPMGDCDADGTCEDPLMAGPAGCGVCGHPCDEGECSIGRCPSERARDGLLAGAGDEMCGVIEGAVWCWQAADGSVPRRVAADGVSVSVNFIGISTAVCVLDAAGAVTCYLPDGELRDLLVGVVEMATGVRLVCGLSPEGAVACVAPEAGLSFNPLAEGAVELLGSGGFALGFRTTGGRIANFTPPDVSWRVGEGYVGGCLGPISAGITRAGMLEVLAEPWAYPPSATGVGGVVQVDASVEGVCVLRDDGTVACQADGEWTEIAGLEAVRAIGAGAHVMCALTAGGTVHCFLPDGTSAYEFDPPD